MRSTRFTLLLTVLAACSTPVPVRPPDATSPADAFTLSLDAPGVDAPSLDAPAVDAVSSVDAFRADAGPRVCDPRSAFGMPTLLAVVNSAAVDTGATLSADERTIYFSSNRDGTHDVWVANRTDRFEPFAEPSSLPDTYDAEGAELHPHLTPDGMRLLLAVYRPGGVTADYDIWLTSRTVAGGAFSPPVSASGLNSGAYELNPFVSGGFVWFMSDRERGAGNYDIFRAADGATFGAPEPVPELVSATSDGNPVLSSDGLTIYFSSDRSGSMGDVDVWVAHRSTPSGTFSDIALEPAVNSTGPDRPSWLSPDGCRLYLYSERAGSADFDLYVAER